jgi:hypothetical protein
MVALVRDRLEEWRPASPGIFAVGVAALAVALVLGWAVWVLALAIFVPTAIAVVRRPQRGIVIFALLLPLDGVIKVFGPSWADAWKQAFVLGLLVLTFTCPPEARGPAGRKVPGWVPGILGLFALGLISAAFVDRTTAITGLRISYFSVLIAVVIWRCPLDRRDRDHLISVILGMAIFTSLVGLWQQVVGHAYLHSLGYAYEENIRFTVGLTLRSFSTFNLPFSFGFYLMIAILAVLPMALAEPSRLRSKIFFLSLPLLGLGMLSSFVRGAMLGLAIGLLYLAFHRYKILVYGIPLVLVAALFIPSGATVTGAVFTSSSLGERTTTWQNRFEQILDHPLGAGIGTTGAAADRTAIIKKTNRDLAYQPDNSYLKVTFELGVLGLWLLVALLVSMFLSTRATERRCSGIDTDFVAGVSAQWLAIITASLVATYLELVPMDQYFWIMIGIVATMAPRLAEGPAVHGPEPVTTVS